ncbi:MAG: succinate dehydrogenase, cytochrome b556 subunit [Steroidobacteraceae bacterium]
MRPRSPNIQHYRPQLTSVLSIVNRITALISTLAIIAFVAWLVAAALGPDAYGALDTAAASPVGRALLVIATFAFFLHLCGSIRHLFWDAVAGFELRSIYASGWVAVAASIALTAAAWLVGGSLRG